MRVVVTCLLATGALRKLLQFHLTGNRRDFHVKSSTTFTNMDRGIDETPLQEELQNSITESGLAPIIAPMVAQKGKQNMLQSDYSPPLQESTPPPVTVPPEKYHLHHYLWHSHHRLERENRRPGYNGRYVLHPSDRHVGRHGL